LSTPGIYNVTLKTAESSTTKSLKVIKDPNSEGTVEDISLQNELVTKIYDDLNLAINHINSIETIRRQLLDLIATLKKSKQNKELMTMVEKLELEFLEIEKLLIQLKITGTGQDGVRFPKMITEKLFYLANNIQISDFKPADSYIEVYKILKNRLNKISEKLNKLKEVRLEESLKILKDEGVEIIVTE
jgi:hypothetical protein